MTSLMFVALSATIMSDILKTIYMKQYVIADNHRFVKSGQRIIFFLNPHQPTRLDTPTPTSNWT